MAHLKTPLPTQDFQSFASAFVRQLRLHPSVNFRCPQCDTTSVVELTLASRSVEEPAVASPPSNAEGQNPDTQHPDVVVLKNDSPNHPEAVNKKTSGISAVQDNDKTLPLASVRNTMALSSSDVTGGENSNGRVTEPVVGVKRKRKSKKEEALELKMSNISPLFNLRLSDAAQVLGISITSLKNACRDLGFPRWPGRQVRGLQSTINRLQRAIVGQGADSGIASMRSEIPKLQQELNEFFHGTPAQIKEKMHSPSVVTTNVNKRLYYVHGRLSKHHNPGCHNINTGGQPNLNSGLAPPSARKNSTRANRPAKAKKQPEQKQQLAPCTDDDHPPENQNSANSDKESARPSPRKYIRPGPRRKMRLSSRLSSRDTEMKASDLEGLLPEVHDISNVAGREVLESVVQAQNGNNMTLREERAEEKAAKLL